MIPTAKRLEDVGKFQVWEVDSRDGVWLLYAPVERIADAIAEMLDEMRYVIRRMDA
jgi:hypothetical protein